MVLKEQECYNKLNIYVQIRKTTTSSMHVEGDLKEIIKYIGKIKYKKKISNYFLLLFMS